MGIATLCSYLEHNNLQIFGFGIYTSVGELRTGKCLKKGRTLANERELKPGRECVFKMGHVPYTKGFTQTTNNEEKMENRTFIRLTSYQAAEEVFTKQNENALAPVLLHPSPASKFHMKQCAYPSEIKG